MKFLVQFSIAPVTSSLLSQNIPSILFSLFSLRVKDWDSLINFESKINLGLLGDPNLNFKYILTCMELKYVIKQLHPLLNVTL
jgi:hypothetical protein